MACAAESESRNHYAHRNPRAQGQVYCDHVMAMTAEGLHEKSDIAAELAHRDILIAELLRTLEMIVAPFDGAERAGIPFGQAVITSDSEMLKNIRAAIARAEGRQHGE
jgi:hypothetical protein